MCLFPPGSCAFTAMKNVCLYTACFDQILCLWICIGCVCIYGCRFLFAMCLCLEVLTQSYKEQRKD